MNQFLFPIYAVATGFVFALFFEKRKHKNVKLLLAFSGAFLLSITVFELLPEVYSKNTSERIGLLIMVGILFQIVLEFISKGAEHGHTHTSENKIFPWALFISLSVHSVIEGMPITQHNHLVYAIFVHKLPIAIVLTYFLWNSGLHKFLVVLFMFLFALMTPLGTFLAQAKDFVSLKTEITAVVIGMLLHISTTILFESSEEHKFNIAKLLSIVLAIGIAYYI